MQSKTKVVVLDLNVGNIYSLQKALNYIGYDVIVTSDSKKIMSADVIFLPGDSHFEFFMQGILKSNLKDTILELVLKQKYLFGICVGFQSLFEYSQESPNVSGLGILSGKLVKFSKTTLPVPHIGWENTNLYNNIPILHGLSKNEYFYYIHSYCYPYKHKYSIGTCYYGTEFTSIIAKNNIFGTQFHPEKSGKGGMRIIKNFMKIVEN